MGKTTIALLMAKHLVSQGKRVLFVELTSQSSAQAFLQEKTGPSSRPSLVSHGFDWCLLQGGDCLVEYVSSLIKVEKIAKSFFESPLIGSLLNVAPGLNDLAVLGKLTSHIRQHGPGFDYDHVVIDSHSTGSFSSLLAAPQILGASVSSGPMRSQSESIDKVLKDKNWVQYFFVSVFEELPVDELEETLALFSPQYKGQLSVIMNKAMILDKPRIDIEAWKNFMQQRLSRQEIYKNRVLELWDEVYTVDLFTSSTQEQLNKKEQEFLRNRLSV